MKKENGLSDKRLLDALEYIDDKYIAEAAEKIKPKGVLLAPNGSGFRRSIRMTLALAAGLLILSAFIPIVHNIIRNYLHVAGYTETTADETTLTPEITSEEETSSPEPDSTAAETTEPDPTHETTEEPWPSTTAPPEDTTSPEETTAEETTSPSEPENDGSRGLVYRIAGDYAVLDGIGSCTDTDIVVGTYYDGYPVKRIDQWALANTSIQSVKISDTVTRIDHRAFSECKSLESIYISASVNDIDHMAFYECPNITSIVIDPDNKFYEGKNCIIEKKSKCLLLGCRTTVIPSDGSVTCIGYLAFYKISGITSVTIPEGVTDIDTSAFYSCPDLREVHLPSTLVWLPGGEGNAFQNCDNIRIITVAANNPKLYSKNNCVIERETGALIFGSASSVIPNDGSVKIIDRYAFGSTASLTEIVIPEGVTEIRQGAFASCTNLKKISLPKSLTEIDSYAFASCTSLESVTLGENVTYIGTDAFRECASLKYVTFPQKVEYLGESVFGGCASLESIILPEGIELIYGGMFIGCSNLKTVVLPDGLKSIGQSAFRSCTALESIVIPDGVTMIDGAAFFNCSGLKSITIPKSVSVINSETFRDCKELTEIVFLGEVSEWKSIKIGEGWNTDSGIRIIKCSDGDIKLYDEPEYDGSVGLKYSKSGNATIGYYMTLDGIGTCTDIDIVVASYYNGYPVKVIDNNAFNGQTHIKSIRLSDTVEIISYGAFRGCSSLESLYISASLKRIDSHVFWDCGNITKIEIDPNNEVFEGKNCIIEKNRKALVLGCRTTVIPSDGSVTRIDGLAFKDVIGLTSITIPEGVTLLGEDAFSGCPDLKSIHFSSTVDSFELVSVMGCDALEVITVDPKNPRFFSSGNCVIEKTTGTLLLGCGKSVIPNDGSIKKIGYYAFGGSDSLVSIVIPEGVTYIDGYAFASCESLKSVYLPDSLITLGYGVFFHSSALETVRIGKNLETIGSAVFDGCSKLNNLSFPKTLKRMGEMVFMECKSLTSVSFEGTGAEWNAIEKVVLWNDGAGFTTVKCSDGVLELYEYDGSRGLQYVQYGSYAQLAGIGSCTDKDIVISATYNGVPVAIIEDGVFRNNKNIRSVSIPNTVHYIGNDAFAFCTALESVIMPEKLKILGSGAFNGCTSLKSINIPSGITEIDAYTFSECASLTEIVIPEGVTVIENEAFYACGLQKVTLPSTLEWIQDMAFARCSKLAQINIPDGVREIGQNAFKDCVNLTSLTLGSGLELIEECSFENCTSLVSVTFPKSLRLLANDAFAGCTSLTSVHYAGTIQEWNSVDSTGRDYGNSHVWHEGVPAASVSCTDGDVEIE